MSDGDEILREIRDVVHNELAAVRTSNPSFADEQAGKLVELAERAHRAQQQIDAANSRPWWRRIFGV